MIDYQKYFNDEIKTVKPSGIRRFFDIQMKLMCEKEGITEELKATNQMEWVGKMNNLKNSIEEIILERYIYN